jgi:peptide/nickel transport system ATP-binding protein
MSGVEPKQAGADVLRVSGLKVTFHTYAGDVKALDGVELAVRKGELLGLVGESGCGKSVTTLAIVGLLPPNARVEKGTVVLNGVDLLKLSREQMRRARLTDVAIVFQDPMTYLNPVLTVGSQVAEMVTAEPGLFGKALVSSRLKAVEGAMKQGVPDPRLAAERLRLIALQKTGRIPRRELKRLAKLYVISILREVRLPQPEKVFDMYPFELSGGMRQRLMIAMALVRRPKVLLADEMTTALDVTVQAQILQLMKELRSEIDASVVLITHDLAVVAEVCDRVAVMYAGNIVEVAGVDELFRNPLHPYTQGLMASIPRADAPPGELRSIKGSVPNLIFPPSGCRFHPRCPKAFGECPLTKPSLVEVAPGHLVSCLLFSK